MAGWSEAIGHLEQVNAAKLVSYANQTSQGTFSSQYEYIHEDFRDALLVIAGAGGIISTKKLGWWLKANSGRVVNGMRIVVSNPDSHNGARYLLEKI